jgi:N-acetyl sugar amidotransferase
MDESATDITFDANGICNYCAEFLQRSGGLIHENAESRKSRLEGFVSRVKAAGQGKRYDCVIGVSGGVDSSWALVQAVRLGLRPLAVHMDNGWNSELAQNNIANLVQTLNVDLYTHVIDWPEYRSLMQAFFAANVVDVELLYDNAMLKVNYKQAAEHGVKFILAGTNEATEGMQIPATWNWFKLDKKNIKSIAAKFSKVRIKTFPSIGVLGYLYYEYFRRVKWISFLDFFPYNKNEVLDQLERDFGYKRYPYKHYESIFTRFYQGYILPKKFGVDKRRVHLSTLVAAGQMTREAAAEDLQSPPYASETELAQDIQYFLKKMQWSRAQLNEYLAKPEIGHSNYASEKGIWTGLNKAMRFVPPALLASIRRK